MSNLPEPVARFLSKKHIAVAGVSRDSNQPANLIYHRLRDSGHKVFAINPNAAQVEGAICYPDLRSVPQPIEAVMIATHPKISAKVVRDCAELGIGQVWFHRSFGDGSVSDDAVHLCKERGIDCIIGGCPMMYCDPVDFGHRCMKWLLKMRNRVPG
jgi:predicted CoA-binding protein